MFGINYVATKHVLETVPAQAWVFLRVGTATLLLAPVVFALYRRLPPRGTRLPLALAACLGVVANQILFTEGLARTTPAHSSVLNASIPVQTLLFAVLAGQERFTLRKVVAIGVALTGVLTLLEVDRMVGEGIHFETTMVGDLLSLGNAATFSLFLVLMRRFGRDVDPLLATGWSFVVATPLLFAWSLPALDAKTFAAVTAAGVWPVALFVVVGATIVTYVLNNWALRRTHSSQVALYIYVQPVVATLLSVALGIESPGARFFVAASLVFGGILIEISGRSSRSTA